MNEYNLLQSLDQVNSYGWYMVGLIELKMTVGRSKCSTK